MASTAWARVYDTGKNICAICKKGYALQSTMALFTDDTLEHFVDRGAYEALVTELRSQELGLFKSLHNKSGATVQA